VRVRLATNTFPRPRTVRELSALGTSFIVKSMVGVREFDMLIVFLFLKCAYDFLKGHGLFSIGS
jgi:hypothetical protein